MYGPTWQIAEERERHKQPGQKFCDEYAWKLNNKYRIVQRPDKITWVGGTVYRTITPTTHVWLESIYNPKFHVWIDFNGDTAVIKTGIHIRIENDFPKSRMYADSSKYENCIYMSDYNKACDYLLRIVN